MGNLIRQFPREERISEIAEVCGVGLVKLHDAPHLDPIFVVKKGGIVELLRILKERFEYNHLSDLSACDNSPASPRFNVTYNLFSYKKRTRVMVKAEVDDGESISTITTIWKGANWLEREVYDMFGIIFDGHPYLRRLYLPDEFKGHPLRKEFPYNYRQEFSKSLSENIARSEENET